MKFLCDVHIAYKVVKLFNDLGFESIHVNSILDKWQTKDEDICKYADLNDLIVVSKDADFRNSFYIKGTPKKLIKINLGNISNNELMEILNANIDSIFSLNNNSKFIVEIDKDYVSFNIIKD